MFLSRVWIILQTKQVIQLLQFRNNQWWNHLQNHWKWDEPVEVCHDDRPSVELVSSETGEKVTNDDKMNEECGV